MWETKNYVVNSLFEGALQLSLRDSGVKRVQYPQKLIFVALKRNQTICERDIVSFLRDRSFRNLFDHCFGLLIVFFFGDAFDKMPYYSFAVEFHVQVSEINKMFVASGEIQLTLLI